MAEVLCWACAHRRAIPGNAHVRCGARVSDGDSLVQAVALLMPEGFGWAHFDPGFPRPITTCALFERPESSSTTPAGAPPAREERHG
jgi:hypothetical protein